MSTPHADVDDRLARVKLSSELQLRVATGEPLTISQADITLEGHAIEARVYAEDSFNGFLPQAGRTSIVRWGSAEHVRVDHALEPAQEVSTAYDPMLGKVIAWGEDREAARAALVDALEDTAILGITTNTGFLRTLAASEQFRDAAIDTAWLDHNEVGAPDEGAARQVAAWAAFRHERLNDGPFRSDGFRLGMPPAPVLVHLDQLVELHLPEPPPGACRVSSSGVEVSHLGQRFVFERPDLFADHASDHAHGLVTAPMPGTVVSVQVDEGAQVEEGQPLVVLEAMKMELALRAPFTGVVTSMRATAGAQVALGATLVEVDKVDGQPID